MIISPLRAKLKLHNGSIMAGILRITLYTTYFRYCFVSADGYYPAHNAIRKRNLIKIQFDYVNLLLSGRIAIFMYNKSITSVFQSVFIHPLTKVISNIITSR